MLLVQVTKRLGVGMRREGVSRTSGAAAADLVMVVDLAVEHDDDRAILVEDRLLASGDVDDAQAAHAERDAVITRRSVLRRPGPVLDRGAHA